MKNLLFCLFISISMLLHAQKKDCCKSSLDITKLPSIPLKELGAEYQKLKAIPKNCCNYYNSDFQLIMNECSYKIRKGKLSKRKILKYMGKPDDIEMPLEYKKHLHIQDDEKVLVYFWRDWHDFMYICLKNGKARKVEWFYAYE